MITQSYPMFEEGHQINFYPNYLRTVKNVKQKGWSYDGLSINIAIVSDTNVSTMKSDSMILNVES